MALRTCVMLCPERIQQRLSTTKSPNSSRSDCPTSALHLQDMKAAWGINERQHGVHGRGDALLLRDSKGCRTSCVRTCTLYRAPQPCQWA